MNAELAFRTASKCAAIGLLLFCSTSRGAIGTVASVDPLLGAPILYDSGVPIPLGGFGTPTLDATLNGGFTISGLEVLGPAMVYTTTDDRFTGFGADDTSMIQLNASAGPGTNALVGPLVPFVANARGYDLTLNPVSGFLGVAGALLACARSNPRDLRNGSVGCCPDRSLCGHDSAGDNFGPDVRSGLCNRLDRWNSWRRAGGWNSRRHLFGAGRRPRAAGHP